MFRANYDALYYCKNFAAARGTPIDCDLLDINKLRDLYTERFHIVASIFTPRSFEWLTSVIGAVEEAATNEYMCHEGGHRLAFSIEDKLAAGYFKNGGRSVWPLIYVEEYRADANSWTIAAKCLKASEAARVIVYTLIHRFGLAVENLRESRPGAGYVPFLHFQSMMRVGLLRTVQSGPRELLDFSTFDPVIVVDAANSAASIVDYEINQWDDPDQPDQSAEAMLSYAAARLRNRYAAETFARVIRQSKV